MTDDRSVFSTPNQMRCFGDIFPFKFTLTRTRHPDKSAIIASAQKEVQQLIDMQVAVEQTDEQVRKLQRDTTVRILNSRFVHKRKYKISPVDEKEYFDKWKGRLAAQGQHQEPGIDCVGW